MQLAWQLLQHHHKLSGPNSDHDTLCSDISRKIVCLSLAPCCWPFEGGAGGGGGVRRDGRREG